MNQSTSTKHNCFEMISRRLRESNRVISLIAAAILMVGVMAGCTSTNGGGYDGGSDQPQLTYATTISNGRAAIQKLMYDTDTPSASVALTDGDRIVWSETFGYIDETKKSAPTSSTMFCIGSVSKIVTAAAVMKLVDRGQLNLDTPIVKYMPDFTMQSPEYSQITVRMLLYHAAGFGGADYRNMFTYAPFSGYSTMVKQGLALQRLKHAPGYMSVYSNDCCTMVEPLIEAVSGKSFSQFMQAEVLTPLGMNHSRYALTAFPAGSFAPGFAGGFPMPQEFGQAYGSGGLYTTPEDMAKFAMMLMNGGRYGGTQILSAASVSEMGTDQTVRLSFYPVPTNRYGLGWDSVEHPGLAAVGVKAWHKKGGTNVYESDFVVAPQEKLAVMITFSQRTMKAGLPAEQIMLNALVEKGRISAVPQPLPDVPQPVKTATAADLNAITGYYANKNGSFHVEAAQDGTLTVSSYFQNGAWGSVETGLKLRTDGSFSSDASPNVSYRALVADGRRYLLNKAPKWSGHYLEEQPYAQLIEPGAALSNTWQNRVGKKWLAVNEDAQSTSLVNGNLPVFSLSVQDGFSGYLFTSSIIFPAQIVDPSGSDTLAKMFMLIPVDLGRDLNDVVIETRNGEEWVRYGSNLFRPQATVPVFSGGSANVTIGSEGLAEWRKLQAGGSVSISGASAWKLYDADMAKLLSAGSGSVNNAPAGAYLLLYGAPGASITLTAASAQ